MTRQSSSMTVARAALPPRRSARLAATVAASVVASVARPSRRASGVAKRVAHASPPLAANSERMVAFLRGVNMFGGVHSMAAIRSALTDAGFVNVATFHISGNVVFDRPRSARGSRADLESQVERVLQATFDQSIPVFVRSMSEMQRTLAKLERDPAPTPAHYFGMLKLKLTPEQQATIEALAPATDDVQFLGDQFAVHAGDTKTSVIYKAGLEKKLGVSLTVRKVNTWRRVVDKFGTQSDPLAA